MTPAVRNSSGALLLAALVACSSTGVVQVNPGTYMVSATGTSPAFTGTEDAIKRAYRDAGAFCAQDGRVVETVSLDTVEQAIGRPGRATLHFRCVADSGESTDQPPTPTTTEPGTRLGEAG